MTKGLTHTHTHTHTQLLQGALSAEGSRLHLSLRSPAAEAGSKSCLAEVGGWLHQTEVGGDRSRRV